MPAGIGRPPPRCGDGSSWRSASSWRIRLPDGSSARRPPAGSRSQRPRAGPRFRARSTSPPPPRPRPSRCGGNGTVAPTRVRSPGLALRPASLTTAADASRIHSWRGRSKDSAVYAQGVLQNWPACIHLTPGSPESITLRSGQSCCKTCVLLRRIWRERRCSLLVRVQCGTLRRCAGQ